MENESKRHETLEKREKEQQLWMTLYLDVWAGEGHMGCLVGWAA
jgi:hypothetical protein